MISTVLIDSEARPSQRARVISAWVDVAQVVFNQQIQQSNATKNALGDQCILCIGRCCLKFFLSEECIFIFSAVPIFHLCLALTCVFAGIAGAKELLIVESDCVRVAVKPNLQAEEGLAGEETYP